MNIFFYGRMGIFFSKTKNVHILTDIYHSNQRFCYESGRTANKFLEKNKKNKEQNIKLKLSQNTYKKLRFFICEIFQKISFLSFKRIKNCYFL